MKTINLVISGPATVGKSRLLKYCTQRHTDLRRGVSHTTRPLRTGETNGKDYHFISEDHFKKLSAQDDFAFYKMNSIGNYYGILHQEIEIPESTNYLGTLLDLDPDGFQHLKRTYKNVVGVYLLPRSVKNVEDRLRERYHLKLNRQSEEFNHKLILSIDSLKHAIEYDYVLYNDKIISVAHKIHQICEIHAFCLEKEDVKQWIKMQIGENIL